MTNPTPRLPLTLSRSELLNSFQNILTIPSLPHYNSLLVLKGSNFFSFPAEEGGEVEVGVCRGAGRWLGAGLWLTVSPAVVTPVATKVVPEAFCGKTKIKYSPTY
jgi:hypothetical protein